MLALTNKVAIITGASSGIGFAAATLFAKEGARVVVAARRQPELDTLVDAIIREGGEAVALAGDVNDQSYAQQLVDLAMSKYGGVDVAFNNAGTLGELGAFCEMTLSQWQATINTNLTSAFLGARAQIPVMRKKGGSIIFTSSFVGCTVGMPGMAAYATSKAGVIGLTQTLAAEYGNEGIRVNALLPGGTDTAMSQSFANTPEKLKFINGLHALK